MPEKSILVVEDDPPMRSSLERALRDEGYRTRAVDNGVDALIAMAGEQFAAAVVDVMLPGMNGFEICRRVRQSGSTVPILLLTARDAVDDRVTGLDSGADDYLTKPFSLAELAARIRAMLRRDPAEQRLRIVIGDIEMDTQSRRVSVGEQPMPLSPNEFAILRGLLIRSGEEWGKQSILEEVWGTAEHITPNIVEQYVSTLRRKLAGQRSAVSIVTVRGVGYRAEVT